MSTFRVKKSLTIIFLAIYFLPIVIFSFLKSNIAGDILNGFANFNIGENRSVKRDLKIDNVNDFKNEIESYADDNMPFRQHMILMNRMLTNAIEKPYIDSIEPALVDMFYGNDTNDISEDEESNTNPNSNIVDDSVEKVNTIEKPITTDKKTNEASPKGSSAGKNNIRLSPNGNVIIGKDNWLYLNGHNIDYYKGTNMMSQSYMETCHNNIAILSKLLKEKNKKLILVYCLEKEKIYNEFFPKISVINKEGRIENFLRYIDQFNDISYVYPKNSILSKKDKYRVYRKYDAHHSYAGAFITYCEILKKMGSETIPDIDNMRMDIYNEFERSDLYEFGALDFGDITDDFNYKIYYKDNINTKIIYSDMDVNKENNAYTHILVSDNDINKNAMIFGDSFRIYLSEYLKRDFKKTYVIGSESPNNEIVKEAFDNSDVIILEVVERNEDTMLPLMISKLVDFAIK